MKGKILCRTFVLPFQCCIGNSKIITFEKLYLINVLTNKIAVLAEQKLTSKIFVAAMSMM